MVRNTGSEKNSNMIFFPLGTGEMIHMNFLGENTRELVKESDRERERE